MSTPNLRIIDFSFGHVGSAHDSTAWEQTRLVQENEHLMDDGEWVWADSAYPVSNMTFTCSLCCKLTRNLLKISTWVVAPYKKPERDLPLNEIFNNHLSKVRIRSEHAIGFLKGRFHSLKNLPVSIKNKTGHIIATYWVAACIGLHSFAMDCEARERAEEHDGQDLSDFEDSFIAEGLSSASDSSVGGGDGARAPSFAAQSATSRLQRGKACREKLKRRLFRAKERHITRRAEERRQDAMVDSDEDL